MRVYMDACSLQRPLDNRSQPRINVEAEAVLTALTLVESGDLELLSSDALQFEIGCIPDGQRQARAQEMLALARDFIKLNDAIESGAAEFVEAGLRPVDALHLSSACEAKADFFCTCDDKLLKKAKKLKGLTIKVVSPLELIAELTL
jgi:predicted nucleic acid-binding protein